MERGDRRCPRPLDGPAGCIDVSTVLAGPLCAQVLGDFGADVIKIEHPQRGDSFRTHGPAKDGHGLWWKIVCAQQALHRALPR